MHTSFHFIDSAIFRKFHIPLLALIVSLGLCTGICIANQCSPNYTSLMGVAPGNVSIVGLSAVISFPLLISLFSILNSKRHFLFALCFLRYFLFGYCAWGFLSSCGYGGWLFSFLYMFSGHVMLPLEMWLIVRYSNREDKVRFKDFLIYLCLISLVVLFEQQFISPLLFMMAEF